MKEIEAIKKVIDSDNYSMGKEVKEYEKEFAAFSILNMEL